MGVMERIEKERWEDKTTLEQIKAHEGRLLVGRAYNLNLVCIREIVFNLIIGT